MIISHQHKFIFFAVPKTGTHAIRFALRDHLDDNDEEQVNLFVKRRLADPILSKTRHGHLSCQEVKEVMDPVSWQQYFKFAFVRNPFDRFVSFCFFTNRENRAFQKDPLPFMKSIFIKQQSKNSILFRPQSQLLCDNDGKLMVDFAGKYEDFQQQFNLISSKIGFPIQQLEHVNASSHKNWTQYYDRALKEQVATYYSQDFESFGYERTF